MGDRLNLPGNSRSQTRYASVLTAKGLGVCLNSLSPVTCYSRKSGHQGVRENTQVKNRRGWRLGVHQGTLRAWGCGQGPDSTASITPWPKTHPLLVLPTHLVSPQPSKPSSRLASLMSGSLTTSLLTDLHNAFHMYCPPVPTGCHQRPFIISTKLCFPGTLGFESTYSGV